MFIFVSYNFCIFARLKDAERLSSPPTQHVNAIRMKIIPLQRWRSTAPLQPPDSASKQKKSKILAKNQGLVPRTAAGTKEDL
jgi:hypothetical protein